MLRDQVGHHFHSAVAASSPIATAAKVAQIPAFLRLEHCLRHLKRVGIVALAGARPGLLVGFQLERPVQRLIAMLAQPALLFRREEVVERFHLLGFARPALVGVLIEIYQHGEEGQVDVVLLDQRLEALVLRPILLEGRFSQQVQQLVFIMQTTLCE